MQKGFALVIAVILTSVSLAIGIALLDVAYKQVILSATAKQSQYAFYAADGLLECALYHDQKFGTFDFNATTNPTSIQCDSTNITPGTPFSSTVGQNKTVRFSKPCPGGGTSGTVTVYKNGSTGATSIFATGYNVCNASDPRRIERGLKAIY
jgi:Tfp pilus assembly protein PilX